MRFPRLFVAGQAWMAIGAMLWLASGCGESAPPKAESKFQVAKSEGETADSKSEKTPLKSGKSSLPTEDGETDTNAAESPGLESLENGELPTDPKQLFALLKKLGERRPQGRTRQEQMEDMAKMLVMQVAVADKLLASKGENELRHVAAQAKLQGLMRLAELGVPNADKDRNKVAEDLAKDSFKPIAQLGKLMLFGLFADEFANESPETGEAMVQKIEELLDSEGASPVTIQLVTHAEQILTRKGFREDAVKVLDKAAKTFAASEEKELAAVSKQLTFKARLVEANFDESLQKSMEGTEEDRTNLVSSFQKLADAGPEPSLLELANQAEFYMEIGQHLPTAKALIAAVEKTFEGVEDEEVKKQATELVANARKRTGLVGTELPVVGKLADGTEFDWKAYEGKVVLLDFWATWCGPCLKEIPNIRASYEAYKERGFEVIGINMDEDEESLSQFLALQKLPWRTVVSPDAEAKGFKTPLAQQCGVTGIPFIVLLGKDGKVDSIQLRGPALAKRLAEIFPGEEKPADEKAKPEDKPKDE